MVTSPKEEFVELMTELGERKGQDHLSSHLIAILYVEPGELTLEELAERTGYSLSSVSTAMKMIERSGRVKRTHKPGSRKVFFHMEKDVISMMTEIMEKTYAQLIAEARGRVPGIIRRYELEGGGEEELEIIRNYYRQIGAVGEALKRFIADLEDS